MELFQKRAEVYPRYARNDSAAEEVSCPHEYILFQFWIYPLFLFSIVSHSLLWGTPRWESPEPVEILPTDGARRV